MAVFLYLRGIERSQTDGADVRVVVAKQDILAGTELDELIEEGAFDYADLPEDAKVEGAITSLAELEGKKTSSPILEGEQISTARIQGSNELPGGVLGIPDGYQAMSVGLEAQRVAGGAIQSGDSVAVYATFDDAGEAEATATQTGANSARVSVSGGNGVTIALVPSAKILDISSPGDGAAVGQDGQTTLVTLALTPKDTQKLAFAQETGRIWFALLPPGQDGAASSPLTMVGLLK
jgi:pilus assembly protein CpaB